MSVLDLQDLPVEKDATAEAELGGASELSVLICDAAFTPGT